MSPSPCTILAHSPIKFHPKLYPHPSLFSLICQNITQQLGIKEEVESRKFLVREHEHQTHLTRVMIPLKLMLMSVLFHYPIVWPFCLHKQTFKEKKRSISLFIGAFFQLENHDHDSVKTMKHEN